MDWTYTASSIWPTRHARNQMATFHPGSFFFRGEGVIFKRKAKTKEHSMRLMIQLIERKERRKRMQQLRGAIFFSQRGLLLPLLEGIENGGKQRFISCILSFERTDFFWQLKIGKFQMILVCSTIAFLLRNVSVSLWQPWLLLWMLHSRWDEHD